MCIRDSFKDMREQSVVWGIMTGKRPDVPAAGSIDEPCPGWRDLMTALWREDAKARPTFDEAVAILEEAVQSQSLELAEVRDEHAAAYQQRTPRVPCVVAPACGRARSAAAQEILKIPPQFAEAGFEKTGAGTSKFFRTMSVITFLDRRFPAAGRKKSQLSACPPLRDSWWFQNVVCRVNAHDAAPGGSRPGRRVAGARSSNSKRASTDTSGTVSYTHLTLPTILLV